MLQKPAGKNMKNNDTISDFLAKLKNAYLARHKSLQVPYTKILAGICAILLREQFIKDVKAVTVEGHKVLSITLAYPNRRPAVMDIKRVSKPGLRVYVSKKQIPRIYGGLGIAILSTPQGLMDSRQARKKQIGGEVVCKVW